MHVPFSPVPHGSGAGDGEVAPWRAWGTVVVLFLLSTVAWMDRSVIAMVIAPLRAHFGIGDSTIGLIAGLAFSAFYVLFLVPIGWLADRRSPRVILFVGVLVWSGATIAFGLAPTLAVLIAARMCVGAGEGTVSPIAAATIGRVFGRARMGAPMSIFSLGASAGTAIGVVVAGQILSRDDGTGFVVPLLGRLEAWQFVYVVIGVPGAFAALLAFTLPVVRPVARSVASHGSDTASARNGSLAFIRRNPTAFCCTVLGFVLINTAVTSILTWLPEHLRRDFALPPAAIGWYMAAISLGAPLVVQLGIGTVVNRLLARGNAAAPYGVMLVLLVVALPFAVMLWAAATATACALATFVVLALIFPSNPLGLTAIQLIAPDHLRSGLAAIHLAVLGLIGLALGSSLVAAIEDYALPGTGLGAAIAIAVVGCLIAAAILLRVAHRAVTPLLADAGDLERIP